MGNPALCSLPDDRERQGPRFPWLWVETLRHGLNSVEKRFVAQTKAERVPGVTPCPTLSNSALSCGIISLDGDHRELESMKVKGVARYSNGGEGAAFHMFHQHSLPK